MVTLLVTLGLLLLVLAFAIGVRPRDWRVPRGIRERLKALREPSPLYGSDVARWASSESVSKAVGAKPSAGKKPSRPAKAKRLPTRKKPARKPAKPAGAVKARRMTKPEPRAKPKPSAGMKPPTPAPARRRTRSPSRRTELRPVGGQSSAVAARPRAARALTCSIFGWRDGEVADFYAVAFGLQGRDWILERSPRFHWPAGDVPDEAYEAHATLVDALVRAGWRPTGHHGAWYRQCFERAIAPLSERP